MLALAWPAIRHLSRIPLSSAPRQALKTWVKRPVLELRVHVFCSQTAMPDVASGGGGGEEELVVFGRRGWKAELGVGVEGGMEGGVEGGKVVLARGGALEGMGAGKGAWLEGNFQ